MNMEMADKSTQKNTSQMNRVKQGTNVTFNLLFALLAALCILPVIFVFMISISSEESIRQVGYSFIPVKFSSNAYAFLWNERAMIFGALFISVSVTVTGTLLGLILNTTMGYSLSRPNFRLKSFYTWVIFIPMLFGGGMVANYVVNANILNLRNTIWALILPLAGSSYNIVICKTFFKSTIPDSIIESAKIDGASQFRTYTSIVLPISKPLLATISLFLSFGYWNDWFQSSLYISKANLVSLQALLNNMMRTLSYIANNPTAGLSLQQYRNQMPSESVRMAIAIVIVIPIACAYPFFQKYFISGLTIGAVKG
jgi:putative aldouronate transport system permease protein